MFVSVCLKCGVCLFLSKWPIDPFHLFLQRNRRRALTRAAIGPTDSSTTKTKLSVISKLHSRSLLYVLFFLSRTEIIHHQRFSKADIFWARIESFIYFLNALVNPHFAKMFWCSLHQLGPLAETQWRRVDSLEDKQKEIIG